MKIKIQPGLDHITDRSDLLRDFVVFVCKDLQCMPCPIDIVNGREASGLKTTAQYDTQNHHVMVNAKNRHFGDVLRSIAHELVHHKQNLDGELGAPVQDVGGDIEDEANARAGALLKSFAYQEGPARIYEQVNKSDSELVGFLKNTLKEFDRSTPDPNDDGTGGKKPAGVTVSPTDEEEDSSEIDKLPNAKIGDVQALRRLRKNPDKMFSADKFTHRLTNPVPAAKAIRSSFRNRPSGRYRGSSLPIYTTLEGVITRTGFNKIRGNFIEILHRVDKYDSKGDFIGFIVYRSDYNFIGEPLDNVSVGNPVEDGELIGYTNKDADFLSRKISNREFQFRIKKIGETMSGRQGANLSADDAQWYDPIKAISTRLKINEQKKPVNQELEKLKSRFLELLKYSDPLDTMRKTSGPGKRKLGKKVRYHNGIDFGIPEGNPVYSPISGRVVKVVSDVDETYGVDDKVPKGKASGNYVTIRALVSVGDERPRISLTHLSSVSVEEGDFVKSGEEIGKSGNTGRSTGPHLHVTPRRKYGGKIFTTMAELKDAVFKSRKQFTAVLGYDKAFLSLMRISVDKKIPRPARPQSESADMGLVKSYINELISVYGLGRVDPTQGGVGQMFKLGVDYENAGTNIPAVGQGYVDRTHSLPYEITVTTDQEPQELFETIFNDDFETSFVSIVPDQVFYNDNGFRVHAHVATGSNQGDKRDVNLIQTQLYSAVMGLPATPKDANIIIGVKPIPSKIKHFS